MKSFYEISSYGNQPLHLLSDVLFTALLSFLRGGKDYSGMVLFGRQHEAFLQEFISLKNGIPSHDTFSRIFSVLEPEIFRSCLYAYRKGVTKILSRQRIEPDSENATIIAPENNGLPVLQAWVAENCLCFAAPEKPAEVKTELAAFASLIEGLDIRNAVISVDTTGCQKEFASLIAGKGGHYFLPLREQTELYNAVVHSFDLRTADRSSEIREYDRGRIETSRCSIIDAREIFPERTPGVPEELKTIIKTDTVSVTGGKDTRETRYYMSNEAEQSATYFNALVDGFPKADLMRILFKDEAHSLVMQENTGGANSRENLFFLKRFAVRINREVEIMNRMYFNAGADS